MLLAGGTLQPFSQVLHHTHIRNTIIPHSLLDAYKDVWVVSPLHLAPYLCTFSYTIPRPLTRPWSPFPPRYSCTPV